MVKLGIGSLLVGLLLLLAPGCATDAAGRDDERELTVFAAASLTEAFREIAAGFEEQHPGTSVTLNFAGSQQLRFQLEQGARADVFASADWLQMNAVVEAGLIEGEPVSFATNRLVAITPFQGARITSLEDLARPNVKLVLAQPAVPVGAYSRTAINSLAGSPRYGPEYDDRVLANLVSEETNVRNVAQKVALGEADAGIVYRTDAMTPDIAQRVQVIPIPNRFNVAASYPIAALGESPQPDLALQFIDHVLSNAGREVLARYGFGPASPEEASRSGSYAAGGHGR